ncbi:MAG: HDIG domain-containing protein, partial [bacterium]|nr:HDIG domain-containing protein [bacterium]
MDNKARKQIEKYSKSLKWTPKKIYWEHTSQVRDFALMIQKEIGGDKDVVEASALLHDIGKAKLLAPGHEEISA